MVVRPSDWFLVDFGSDPTPGDAFGVRGLAAKYAAIATIAGEASDGVTRARSSGAASAWVGDAGDIFREKSHRMPGELAKANDSYSMVAEALRSWAESVDDTQAQADRGLQQAREAHADLSSAQAALGSAQSSWSTVHAQQLTYQKLQKDYASVPPPTSVTMPTDYQLRSSDRNAQQAQASIAAARSRIADADARLAAAKALVHAAKERRDDAERTIVHRISAAEDHAVKPSSIWEAIQDSAAWQAVVVIATVVLTIVSIVAIFVGGPLVWAIILAATILLVVNALMSIAQGEDAWGELALLAIGLIPGGRLLGLAAHGVGALGRMGVAGEHMAGTVSAMTAGIRSGGRLSMLISRMVDGEVPALSRVATSLGDGVETAVHADSAGAGLLARVFRENFAQTLEVNAARFWKNVEGFDANCTRCVIATDHTLAGAPSSAMPLFRDGDSIAVVAEHFNQSIQDFSIKSGYDTIAGTLRDLGPGSRAIVMLDRGPNLVGHVINVINQGGTVAFIDGQIGAFAKLEDVKNLFLLITKAGA
jgi:uncharacterized protein YukE